MFYDQGIKIKSLFLTNDLQNASLVFVDMIFCVQKSIF